ncbi:MAG TPA: hypothetical protein VNM48_23720, partial [Chloroflexota bacterium]|nr:hypothetical protein [Chloroflexota bacterium]
MRPETIAWFRAAASYLHRPNQPNRQNHGVPRCSQHGVAHTGKLARAAVIDLALLDATDDDAFWTRAVERAGYVASRLAQDPDYGSWIFLPSRLDPRNCSNSVIDSGECSDALSRVLLHPRAAQLPARTREHLHSAVARNSESYLQAAVVEKEITNQRLWGAMGLASAWGVEPRAAWHAALRESLSRSVAEQRSDGSWGYHPSPVEHGVFAGAADLTVYYHGRCLAFLLHILERVPGVDPDGEAETALERGLRFLAAVITPDGRKPLALEGKRWFWDGDYEAGSNAYDIYALVRGAERFGVDEWQDLAARSWSQLASHQQRDGGIIASQSVRGRVPADFVCVDFHTADLAWTAQVMNTLPPPGARLDLPQTEESGPARITLFSASGTVRLESEVGVALFRSEKLAANTQFGGVCGGGGLLALVRHDGERTAARGPNETWASGELILRAAPSLRASLRGLTSFVRRNPPEREGRQWLFVARLLLRQGRPLAAWCRLWRGYLEPLLANARDTAGSQWALSGGMHNVPEGGLRFTCGPAKMDGT